jgi:hypothetical protein
MSPLGVPPGPDAKDPSQQPGASPSSSASSPPASAYAAPSSSAASAAAASPAAAASAGAGAGAGGGKAAASGGAPGVQGGSEREPLSAEELYDLAMAHIAQGYTRRCAGGARLWGNRGWGVAYHVPNRAAPALPDRYGYG